MKRSLPLAAAVAVACGSLAMAFAGPPWQKLDKAKADAQVTGKPLAVYATVDGKDASGC